MNEKLKVSVSASLDDEADELELRRLLVATEREALRDTWMKYQRVGDLLRSTRHNEQDYVALDVSVSVANALQDMEIELTSDADVPHEPVTSPDEKVLGGLTFSQWLNKTALAASVCFMLIMGGLVVNELYLTTPAPVSTVASAEPGSALNESTSRGLLPELPPDLAPNLAQRELVATAETSTNSSEADKRLNDYLLRHAENGLVGQRAVFVPFARLASFNTEDE